MVEASFSDDGETGQRIKMQAPKVNQPDKGETARCEHNVASVKRVAFLQYEEALALQDSFLQGKRYQPKQNENGLRAASHRDRLLTARGLSCDRGSSCESTAASSESTAHEEQQDMRDVGMSEIDFIKFVKTEAARMTASHSSAFSMTSNLKESSLLKRREKAKVSS
eukprot:TRINITY_DN16808_c0_g1_i2.p1 TRINITY_DN16808_c0_g1~~TRINITY_DN16808_c0_g1_i2.p1  ORF type:complete len:193 (+),score=32.39 TRINITY_DN16808_c0_g1_i2:79-579(+)